MKWFNFETSFRTLKDALRAYLKDHNIYFELSECGFACWHFEIKCTAKQAENINGFLDTQSFICQQFNIDTTQPVFGWLCE